MNTISLRKENIYKINQALTLDRLDLLLKRAFDVSVSLACLILVSPLFFVVAVTIKCDSKGPVIFRNLRIGQNCRPFFMYKFRTMKKDAEEMLEKDPGLKKRFEVNFKLKNDSRVTYIGKILRRTGLDELPQLINILVGDMSLVGPRPILREEIKKTSPHRFSVPPGLTGLWQISGKSLLSYDEKCRLDDHYATRRNVIFDLRIIFKTIPAIVRGKGFF